MTKLGHQRQPDGTLLRLDVERGQHIGRLYGADLSVLRFVIGSFEQVTQEMEQWK